VILVTIIPQNNASQLQITEDVHFTIMLKLLPYFMFVVSSVMSIIST